MLDAMTAIPGRKATYAEYLALERSSETKHEYVNGELYAMAGGSPEHARLASKLGQLLRNALAGRPCETFSSDARVRVEATERSAYPDLTIVCGALETSPSDPDAIVNPTVLVEVLSPSTETTDRLEKWAHYRRIPSLQAYVLVAQGEARLETYRRDGRRWIYEEAGPGEVVRIGGIEVDVAIDALYASALGEPSGARGEGASR
jgi:Uma2 family endonuclease